MYTIEQACADFELITESLGYREACNALFKAMTLDDCECYLSAIILEYDLDYEEY